MLSAIVKPVLVLLSLPFILVTLGLFLLVINMAVLALTSWLVPSFDIDGLWTYLGAAIITWLVNTAINSVADVR